MRRWLLWTFRCRLGRRCAHLEASEFPALVVLDYTCGGCGTRYRSTSAGFYGWPAGRERVR